MPIAIRPATAEDAEAAGQICHDVFADVAATHNFPKDFPSPEFAAGLLGTLIAHPRVYGVVAEDGDRLIGSNFVDERGPIFGIGPLTIDPATQNSGVGRRLMQDALDRAAAAGAPGVRLLQDCYHNRSFGLYSGLGFEVRDTTSVLQGPGPAFELPGTTERAATRADTDACTAICVQVHGHPRTAELEDAIDQGTARVVERGGRVTGYTTGVGFIGHSVAESNADLQRLIAGAAEYFGPGFHVPTSNGALLTWCLHNGLRITKLMSLMTVGMYHTPRGAFLPSVIYLGPDL